MGGRGLSSLRDKGISIKAEKIRGGTEKRQEKIALIFSQKRCIVGIGTLVFLAPMARTPRHFDGTGRTGKVLSDLLPEIVKKIGEKSGCQSEEIFGFWPTVIGEAMAPYTEPVSFIDGVFIVKVKSSTLYSLLSQHERPRLLQRLQEKFPVRNLVFRAG